MKRKPTAPRNPLVAAAKFKKAGAHGKTEKALRRAARIELKRECGVMAAQYPFKVPGSGSNPGAPTSSTTKTNRRRFVSAVLFLGSQAARQRTVNAPSAGSIPARGATKKLGAAAGCGFPLQGSCLRGFNSLGLHHFTRSHLRCGRTQKVREQVVTLYC